MNLNRKPTFHVTCAVPRTGRTLNNFLRKLKSYVDNIEDIEKILEVLSQTKKRSTSDLKKAIRYLKPWSFTFRNVYSWFI